MNNISDLEMKHQQQSSAGVNYSNDNVSAARVEATCSVSTSSCIVLVVQQSVRRDDTIVLRAASLQYIFFLGGEVAAQKIIKNND